MEEVSTMVKTRDDQNVKLYAIKLDKKFPELRNFFSKQVAQKATKARSSGVEVLRSTSANQNKYGSKSQRPRNRRSVCNRFDEIPDDNVHKAKGGHMLGKLHDRYGSGLDKDIDTLDTGESKRVDFGGGIDGA
jgi:hypothetical protein